MKSVHGQRRTHRLAAAATATAVGLTAGLAAAPAMAASAVFTHKASIGLSGIFGGGTYGTNGAAVAFDGTNAYIGGYTYVPPTDTVPPIDPSTNPYVGVVKVSDLLSGTPTLTGLPDTAVQVGRYESFNALAWSPTTHNLIGSVQTGGTTGSGNLTTTILSYKSDFSGVNWSRTDVGMGVGMAVDPIGVDGSPAVGFLAYNSGHLQELNLSDGATIADGTNGPLIYRGSPRPLGTAWTSLSFDAQGNATMTSADGVAYGVRQDNTTFAGLVDGSLSSPLNRPQMLGSGQDSVILSGLGPNGSDLLAVSLRQGSGHVNTPFTDMNGDTLTYDQTGIAIVNLDGSQTDLSQILLAGDEDGLGSAWTSDNKSLAYGLDSNGTPTLLVVDLNSNRLDVYQAAVPEPASLALLGLGGLTLMVRRRRRAEAC